MKIDIPKYLILAIGNCTQHTRPNPTRGLWDDPRITILRPCYIFIYISPFCFLAGARKQNHDGGRGSNLFQNSFYIYYYFKKIYINIFFFLLKSYDVYLTWCELDIVWSMIQASPFFFSGKFVEELFEVMSSYFPIDFSPVSTSI